MSNFFPTTPGTADTAVKPAVTLTSEELEACAGVKTALLKKGLTLRQLCPRAVAITTINKKLREDDAVEAYLSFVNALAEYNIKDFDDIYSNMSDYATTVAPRLSFSFPVAGKDPQSRQIFWIKSGPIQPSDEREAVRAGWFAFLAIHADDVSIRDGVTFVIDVNVPGREGDKRIGNERKVRRNAS